MVSFRVRLQASYNSTRDLGQHSVTRQRRDPAGGDAAPSMYRVPLPLVGSGAFSKEEEKEEESQEGGKRELSLLHPGHCLPACLPPSLAGDPEEIRGWLEGQGP